MTLLDSAGKRFSYDVKSQPLKLDVARKPQGMAWWLPARSVQITDTWDKQPESLAFGELAQRTITFMANGAGPEMLPPAPKMAGRGLIAFPDPEERTVELTKDGPISKVVWRWTVRILSPDFGALETDPLEWFDTQSLTPQKITFAPQKVALAGSITAPPPSQGASPGFMQTHAIPLAVLAGLLMGLALIVPGWRLRSWAEITRPFRPALPVSLRRKIVRAASENDARSMWLALRRHNVPPTEQLDRILFGRDPPPVSDLSAIARNIVRR